MRKMTKVDKRFVLSIVILAALLVIVFYVIPNAADILQGASGAAKGASSNDWTIDIDSIVTE